MRHLSLWAAAFNAFFMIISTNGSELQAINFALLILNFGYFLHPTKGFRDGP
jgi:hypothetical protein